MSDFYVTPKQIYSDVNLNPSEKLIVSTIFSLEGVKGFCEQSNKQLGALCGFSPRTVQRSIASLRENKIIDYTYIASEDDCLIRKLRINPEYLTKFKIEKELVEAPSQTPVVLSQEEKLPLPHHPLIALTKSEGEKLKSYFAAQNLGIEDLKFAMDKFQDWGTENPAKFAKKKSHYRCLIDWPFERALERKLKALKVETQSNYLVSSERKNLNNFGDGDG
jgi:hypothetical protein